VVRRVFGLVEVVIRYQIVNGDEGMIERSEIIIKHSVQHASSAPGAKRGRG
jgi:hypothetical protein